MGAQRIERCPLRLIYSQVETPVPDYAHWRMKMGLNHRALCQDGYALAKRHITALSFILEIGPSCKTRTYNLLILNQTPLPIRLTRESAFARTRTEIHQSLNLMALPISPQKRRKIVDLISGWCSDTHVLRNRFSMDCWHNGW